MISNKEVAFKTISKFSSYLTEAIVILITGFVFATVFILIASRFNEDGLTFKIISKLAEASMFIAGAGLIGTVYIIFNQIRRNARPENLNDIEEVFCQNVGKTFTRKTYYEIQ